MKEGIKQERASFKVFEAEKLTPLVNPFYHELPLSIKKGEKIMLAMKEARENKEVSREEEQEKRYIKYQEDREALEVTRLEDNGLYRVDNMITGGVYFIELNGKVSCTCPDFKTRCSSFAPAVKCKHLIGVEKWLEWKNSERAKKEGRHNFDPYKYMIKVNGKDYLEVKFRLHWFRLEHGAWDIRTEIINLDLEKGIALVKADIFDERGNHKSSGLNMETKKNFEEYVMKAETGAIGRALAALGYGSLQCFDLEEGVEKGRIVDAPVSIKDDGGNGNVFPNVTPLKVKVEHNGGNGNNGNGKATANQVRYLGDLCRDLGIKPQMDFNKITREHASQLIDGLELERNSRKNSRN